MRSSRVRAGTRLCEPVAGDGTSTTSRAAARSDLIYVSLGTASLTRREGQHGGVARSRDGGLTWEKVETDYTRATIVPPARPDLVLAGPAPRVGRGGRIVVSADGGDTWEPAAYGIAVPMPDMVELFVAAPDGTVWAIGARVCPEASYASAPTSTPGAPGMISGHTGSRSWSCLAIWRAITSRWISFAPS